MITSEQFDTLSLEQKRCAIAQDVIDRLDARTLYGRGGRLLRIPNPIDDEISLKDSINSSVCGACAKGALIISWVGNFNKYTFQDHKKFDCALDYKGYPTELIELFGRNQLDLMEVYFEGMRFSWTSDEVYYLGKPKTDYAGDLRSIMKNILTNNGTFNPWY
jgi:hypothetical protein